MAVQRQEMAIPNAGAEDRETRERCDEWEAFGSRD